jgi:hypothetical protein
MTEVVFFPGGHLVAGCKMICDEFLRRSVAYIEVDIFINWLSFAHQLMASSM